MTQRCLMYYIGINSMTKTRWVAFRLLLLCAKLEEANHQIKYSRLHQDTIPLHWLLHTLGF